MSTEAGRRVIAPIALLLPMLAVLAGSAAVAAGWAVGAEPFWPVHDLTLSEAAAVRDGAEVLRLIEMGHDPNRRWPVREDIIDGERHDITPLEAAILIRRLQVVEILVRNGVTLTPAQRQELVAKSREHEAADIAAFLQSLPEAQRNQ